MRSENRHSSLPLHAARGRLPTTASADHAHVPIFRPSVPMTDTSGKGMDAFLIGALTLSFGFGVAAAAGALLTAPPCALAPARFDEPPSAAFSLVENATATAGRNAARQRTATTDGRKRVDVSASDRINIPDHTGPTATNTRLGDAGAV